MYHGAFWSDRHPAPDRKNTRHKLDHHRSDVENMAYDCSVEKTNQLGKA